MNDGLIYSFAITDIHDEERSSVWSYNKNDVVLFLKQHGFHENAVYNIDIQEVSKIKYEIKNHELRPYIFRSNNSKEQFVILSTTDIISGVINETASDLEGVESMNRCIERHAEFGILQVLNDLIYQLKFASLANYVSDYEGMDEYSIEYQTQYIKLFCSGNEYDYSLQPNPDSIYSFSYDDLNGYLVDALMAASKNAVKENKYQPITIESYVSSFIRMFD